MRSHLNTGEISARMVFSHVNKFCGAVLPRQDFILLNLRANFQFFQILKFEESTTSIYVSSNKENDSTINVIQTMIKNKFNKL